MVFFSASLSLWERAGVGVRVPYSVALTHTTTHSPHLVGLRPTSPLPKAERAEGEPV